MARASGDGSQSGLQVQPVELVVALNNAMEQWSYFYCDVVKAGASTIAMMINEAVKDSYCY